MTAPNTDPNEKLIALNRKARHDFHVLESWEAGMVLTGTEVKSLRQGRINLTDAHGVVRGNEVWIYQLHISPFDKGNRFNHDPLRPRKLLLHRREIRYLIGKTQEKGLTLIPLRMYFKSGRVKLELGLCKGKKLYDKRADQAERDARREMERAIKVSVQ